MKTMNTAKNGNRPPGIAIILSNVEIAFLFDCCVSLVQYARLVNRRFLPCNSQSKTMIVSPSLVVLTESFRRKESSGIYYCYEADIRVYFKLYF